MEKMSKSDRRARRAATAERYKAMCVARQRQAPRANPKHNRGARKADLSAMRKWPAEVRVWRGAYYPKNNLGSLGPAAVRSGDYAALKHRRAQS